MSSTPPETHGIFAYANEGFYAESSNCTRHRRASPSEIEMLFRTGWNPLESTYSEPVGHWYEAQLLHYGLAPSKTKSVARRRLFDAVSSGILAVPPQILRIEADLKKEWLKKDRATRKQNLRTRSYAWYGGETVGLTAVQSETDHVMPTFAHDESHSQTKPTCINFPVHYSAAKKRASNVPPIGERVHREQPEKQTSKRRRTQTPHVSETPYRVSKTTRETTSTVMEYAVHHRAARKRAGNVDQHGGSFEETSRSEFARTQTSRRRAGNVPPRDVSPSY